MKNRKNRRQILIPAGVIIPGIIISILGLYYVSQQKASRELNLEREYKLRINEIRLQIEGNAVSSVNKVFEELSELDPDITDPTSILETVKSLVVNNPVVRYPFILDNLKKYIFPVSSGNARSGSRSPDLAVSDPAIRTLYLEGRDYEFSKEYIPGALKKYSDCLRKVADKRAIPYILNAMARCYFKEKKYHQASYYYQAIISDHNKEIKKDLPLWLTIQRQEALSQKNLGLTHAALKHYLAIYELIIRHESLTGSDRFEMYKNEALDNLSGSGEVLKNSDISKYTSENIQELQKTTELDRVLDWRFIESAGDTVSSGEVVDEERFLKLRELHTPSDEKTWFYRTIRNKIDIKTIGEENNIRSFLFFPANRNINIGIKKFGTTEEGDPHVFGFMISDQYIIDNYFTGKGSGRFSPGNSELKIEYNKSIDPEVRNSRRTKIIINTPFENILNGYSLILYSTDPDLFRTIAGREVWINYGLIIILITVLLLGTILFYKYITKEMELLRSKAEFIDRVSHTLKTPITRMRLLAENITSGWINDKNKRDQFLNSIVSETEGMNETINNMLNFSQIDSGKKFYKFREVSIKDILVDYLKNNHDDEGIRTEMADDLPMLSGDPDGILLIISNLIQNSIKYSTGEKNILIRLTGDEKNIKLEVHDKGIGISLSEKKKIFEKFFRSGIDKVTAIEGSGLGLFITAHAVAAHNGRISVESKPGEGSSFIVLFPVNDTIKKQ